MDNALLHQIQEAVAECNRLDDVLVGHVAPVAGDELRELCAGERPAPQGRRGSEGDVEVDLGDLSISDSDYTKMVFASIIMTEDAGKPLTCPGVKVAYKRTKMAV